MLRDAAREAPTKTISGTAARQLGRRTSATMQRATSTKKSRANSVEKSGDCHSMRFPRTFCLPSIPRGKLSSSGPSGLTAPRAVPPTAHARARSSRRAGPPSRRVPT